MFRLPTLLLSIYWLIIFTGTHLPKASLPEMGWSDKTYHCLGYMGLGFMLCWVARAKPHSKQIAPVIAIGLIYAVLDELTQELVPGRTFDIYDIAADAVGVLLGISVYLVARRVLMSSDRGKRLIQTLSISIGKPRH